MPFGLALRIVMVLAVVAGFWIGHLHLRFNLDTMQAETLRLQNVESMLHSDINAMRSANETLKQPERLYDYARQELGMIALAPAQRETLRMPEEIYTRYALALSEASSSMLADRPFAPGDQWVSRLGRRVGLLRQAEAAEGKIE